MMVILNSFEFVEGDYTFRISQSENGFYTAERINMYDDNDYSATTKPTMFEINKWLKENKK